MDSAREHRVGRILVFVEAVADADLLGFRKIPRGADDEGVEDVVERIVDGTERCGNTATGEIPVSRREIVSNVELEVIAGFVIAAHSKDVVVDDRANEVAETEGRRRLKPSPTALEEQHTRVHAHPIQADINIGLLRRLTVERYTGGLHRVADILGVAQLRRHRLVREAVIVVLLIFEVVVAVQEEAVRSDVGSRRLEPQRAAGFRDQTGFVGPAVGADEAQRDVV